MKKAIFTPLLVLFTIIILLSLAFTISKAEKAKQEIITGEIPLELLITYNEGEKLSFYIEESLKISVKDSLETLKKNAGYPENNNCEKKDNIIIWNSCGYFDTDENFNMQFKEELNKYLLLYPQKIEAVFTQDSIEFKEIIFKKEIKDKNLLKSFFLEYTLKPRFDLPAPDLSIYNDIYNTAQQCSFPITDDELTACINNLEAIKNTKITSSGDYLQLENNGIKLLINIKQPLQPPKKSITIV